MKSLGARLKHYRTLKGLNMDELARLIGVPVSTYKEWEYGRAIQGEPYDKLSEALGIGVAELITGEPPKARVLKALASLDQARALLNELERELRSLQ